MANNLGAALLVRLAQADVASLPDWAAAEVLNAPDATLPIVVTWEPTSTGIGGVMDALGPHAGAALLDALASLAPSNPTLRWGLRVLESGGLDFSLASTRAQIDAMVVNEVMTGEQRDRLFSLSRRERHPSWAEFHGVTVDARAVGIARGAKE
jgi:hypothetical protein